MVGPTSVVDEAPYRGFISYSHKDQSWARWLLARLEAYRLPADLIGKPSGTGEPVPARLGRMFRDRDDASAGDLAEEIRRALAQSRHLIVIASPASARSRYVDKEIREFCELNATRSRQGRVLVLIVAGEPNVSSEGAVHPLECLPPSLRGGITGPDGRPIEPLAADARPVGDGKTRAVAKLVSGLLDIRYDSLVRRDLQRRRRTRMLATAVALLAVTLTSGVGWRIETDRREKLRLEQVQAQVDRERRTLAAVNQAVRARDLLSAGNIDDAVRLARGGLATDGSIPFIPQAYNVLYDAHHRGASPRTFDLVEFDTPRDLHTFGLDDGTYLTWSKRGRTTIWSPTVGTIHLRETSGFERAPAALGGSVVFIEGLHNDFRYNTDGRVWDTLNYGNLSFEFLAPVAQIPIDANTLIGCRGGTVFGIGLPASGDGDAEIRWRVELPDATCSSMARASDGSILIGTWQGQVIRFDHALRAELMRYDTGRKDWIMWIDVAGDKFSATEVGFASIFRLDGNEPVIAFQMLGSRSPISPDGRHAVETAFQVDGESFAIHDLESGGRTPVRCVCSFQGFDEAGNVLTLERDLAAVIRDAATGDVVRTLHRFDTAVDTLATIAGDSVLIGYRKLGPETIVPLGRSSSAILDAAAETDDALSSAVFVGDNEIAAVTVHRVDGGSTRYDARVFRRGADGSTQTLWRQEGIGGGPRGYGSLHYLGHGIVSLIAAESVMSLPGVLRILLAEDGRELFSTRVEAEPIILASGRTALLVGEETLVAYDLVERAAHVLDTPPLGPAMLANWSAGGNRIVAASADAIHVFDVGDGGPPAGRSVAVDGFVHHLCVTADGTMAYVIAEDGPVYLARWLLSDGAPAGRFDIPDDDEASIVILADTVYSDRRFRNDHVACDAERMTIRGYEETALVWDVDAASVRITPEKDLPVSPVPVAVEPVPDAAPIEREVLAGARVMGRDSSVLLVDGNDGRLLRRFPVDASRVVSTAYLADRGWVAAGFENGTVRVWDASTPGTAVIALTAHGGSVVHLDANVTGTALVSGDFAGGLNYWPVLSVGELLALFPDD